jgi:hypothetical protein
MKNNIEKSRKRAVNTSKVYVLLSRSKISLKKILSIRFKRQFNMNLETMLLSTPKDKPHFSNVKQKYLKIISVVQAIQAMTLIQK